MQKPQKRRWIYELWGIFALGLFGFGWMIWMIVSPKSSTSERIVGGTLLVCCLSISSIPLLFDFRARREIRRTCKNEGTDISKIENRKTHYSVFVVTPVGTESRKCVVHSGVVKWLK